MFHLNDIVCHIENDGHFEFGRVMIPSKDGMIASLDPLRYLHVAWCNGGTEILDTHRKDGDVGIASRKLRLGDRIKSSYSGSTGHVIGVNEFATLQSTDNPNVIYKDIPVERLSTIMKFYGYPGVHILYNNWIGMVLSANRRITYSHNNDIYFSVTDQNENAVQVPPWMDPYSVSDNSMLYPGKQFIFTKKMWQQGKFDSIWGQVKSLPLVGKVFVVENIEVICIKVEWLCPADISKQDENGWDSNAKPENLIEGNSLYRIRNLSIPSYLLATNGSGRIFQVTEEDIPITSDQWRIIFSKEVLPQQMTISSSSGANDEPDKKRMKLDIIPDIAAQSINTVSQNTADKVDENRNTPEEMESLKDVTTENKNVNPEDIASGNSSEHPEETDASINVNPEDIATNNSNNHPKETDESINVNPEDTATNNSSNHPEETKENIKENSEDNSAETINGILGDVASVSSTEKSKVTSSTRIISKSKQTNAIVVKVLFLRQVVTVLYDDATAQRIVSSACIPLTDIKKEEHDFLFPFGCWVKRKRREFYDEEDLVYGIVIHVISAAKCIVKWTQIMDEKLSPIVEECWNCDLLYHQKFNSLCRGGIVLWDGWQCGVILDHLSANLRITVKSFSGEILKMEPHNLRLVEYHGYWDVLRQKWLVSDVDCYLNELRMNPYAQSEETLTNRILFFENVPISHSYYTVEIPYGDVQGNANSFANTILKEFYFFQEHLPDGIWVQFYLDRLDLISAVIRGARGTPYESILFFFDIKVPLMYPAVPPQVRFVTFGEEKEINPNIDSKGFICSSLLETAPDGSYLERWTKISNIMQILLSIQGLYLCEHPLFNKPAYSLLPSYQQSSLSKSEKDLALSRQYTNNIICTNLVLYYTKALRSSPSHWRQLIISNLFESLEGLLKRMKDAEVIPKAYTFEASNDCFDKKTFSAEVINATIHLELTLQDVKENKWQLYPQISTK